MAFDVLGGDVENAGFGGEHEKPRLRERPPGRAQSVAVQCRAQARAVGKADGSGAVPRLHQGGVVFVERAHVVAHMVFRAPRLRDEHHHRVRRIASGRDEQLEHVVQRGRVGLSAVDDRQQLLQLVAEQRRDERAFARGKGVEVALQRVDLAVVGDGAERMREFPGRERVRGIALVDDRERRNEIRIGEVGVELLDLRGEQKPLVDDRLRRAGADVGLRGRLLDLPADDVEPPLER